MCCYTVAQIHMLRNVPWFKMVKPSDHDEGVNHPHVQFVTPVHVTH